MTARQVSVDYSIAATAKWAAAVGLVCIAGLVNRHQLGSGVPGTTTYCLSLVIVLALSTMSLQPGEFIVESGRPAGDANADQGDECPSVRSASSTPRRRMWYD